MTRWIPPSYENPHLTLPKGVTTSPIVAEQLTVAAVHLKVPVSDAFLMAWNGPIVESPASICDALGTLTSFFNHLIRLGQGDVKVSEKESPRDFVTEMDIGLEMVVRVWLNHHFPHHKIIGEEGYKDQLSPEDTVWYIDPIDGTSNFVDGHVDVAFQMGSTRQGKPYVAVMGLPFEDRVVSGHCDASGIQGLGGLPLSDQYPFAIGAEFREHKLDEADLFDEITMTLKAKKNRIKSIGINLLHCITGQAAAFYKPDLKLWDAIAPLCLLEFACPDYFAIDFYIPCKSGPITQENHQAVSIFGNDQEMITRLNKKHLTNSRIGTLIVTPKNRPDLQHYITEVCFQRALEETEDHG